MASIDSIGLAHEGGMKFTVRAEVQGYKAREEVHFDVMTYDGLGVPRSSYVLGRTTADGVAEATLTLPKAWALVNKPVLVCARIADMGKNPVVAGEAYFVDGRGGTKRLG